MQRHVDQGKRLVCFLKKNPESLQHFTTEKSSLILNRKKKIVTSIFQKNISVSEDHFTHSFTEQWLLHYLWRGHKSPYNSHFNSDFNHSLLPSLNLTKGMGHTSLASGEAV